MSDTTQPAVAAPQEAEISDDAAAALFRGEAIADEVDKPKKARAKAVEVKPPKDYGADENDEPPVKAKATVEAKEEPEDEPEDDDDDEEDFQASQLKVIAQRQKERLDATRAELAELKKELADAKRKADLSMESLYDDDMLSSLTKKERDDLAAYLFYTSNENVADDEVKNFIKERRESVRTKKLERTLEEERRAVQERLAESQAEAARADYRASVRETVVDMSETIPSLMSLFDGDRKAIATEVMDFAVKIARSGVAESDDEVSPESLLKLLEERAEKLLSRQTREKKIKSTAKVGKRTAPVADMSEDEENDYLARLISGKR